MKLLENRRYSKGVSKNPFLDTHLVSMIFLATLHSFAIIRAMVYRVGLVREKYGKFGCFPRGYSPIRENCIGGYSLIDVLI